jgi:ATP/maltotriose-dependent transcriptional regulator MalT
LTLYKEVDDKYDITLALVILAFVYLLQGDYDRARTLGEEAAVLGREGGDSWDIANSLWLLGLVISYQGDLTLAQTLLEECLALARREGYKEVLVNALFVLGHVTLQQGDYATARVQLEESLSLSRELGEKQHTAQSIMGLAWVSFVQGDYAAAYALLEKSLILSNAGNKWFIAACLVGYAALAAAQGAWIWATRLLGTVWALCQAIRGVLPPAMRVMQEFISAASRAQLGEDVFTVAWAEGCTMTPEKVLAAQEPVIMPTKTLEIPSPVPHAQKASPYPAGLTKREVQVLRLVAQGLTDAQMADDLTISRGTVNTHLKSIYGKIQVKSRNAATRWAIDHGLL